MRVAKVLHNRDDIEGDLSKIQKPESEPLPRLQGREVDITPLPNRAKRKTCDSVQACAFKSNPIRIPSKRVKISHFLRGWPP